ncbi:MAG: alpha/beta hydrolase [Vallitaleaceae bacterium]|jgi:acetyl esterase|nr:alpha/beta hydrolase [Vallitaleaceae bacterium]
MISKVYEYAEKRQFNKRPWFVKVVSTRAIKKDIIMNIDARRAEMGALSSDITTQPIKVYDETIDGYKHPITVRWYEPEYHEPRPIIFYFHGGGWYGGNLDNVHNYCKALSEICQAVVLSVGYSLIPEHPFPHGMEDCYKAMLHGLSLSDEKGIDLSRVIVSGDSAGGNLAACMSILSLERQDFDISHQLLIYPLVDVVNLDTPSLIQEGYMRSGLKALRQIYTSDLELYKHPYISPIMYQNLDKLPKTLVALAEIDGLRDQGMAYAQALDTAGVEVKTVLFKGKGHAFIDKTGNEPAVVDLIEEISTFI